MLFNSFTFAIFFPVVYLLYRLLGRSFRAQNLLLLLAGYIFYGWWDIRFLFLLVLTTVVDYSTGLLVGRGGLTAWQRAEATLLLAGSALAFLVVDWKAVSLDPARLALGVDWGRLITQSRAIWAGVGAVGLAIAAAHLAYPWVERLEPSRRRKVAIAASVTANLGVLGFFKYFNFFVDSFHDLWLSVFGTAPDLVTLNIVLPVGISFYTFQSMSYTLDVYRRHIEPSENIVEFAAFASFFPQLVAGPIERANHLLPQFRKLRPAPTGADVRWAVWLIVWGLYKKMVVADNMAPLVNGVFGPYDGLGSGAAEVPHDGLRLLFAVYAFALQIYGDFSGYTDIARGTAKLMGFDIVLNFNLPYFAVSPSDFWRRWHISLSTWLRDYLYISLGGNRGGQFNTYRNLFLTMLLGGLWHGASWTFVIWGAYHGLLLVVYRLLGIQPEEKGTPWMVKLLMGLLMFHLTCVGWLLFRAKNVQTVGAFLTAVVTNPYGSAEAWALWGQLVYYGGFLAAFQVLQGLSGTLNPLPRLPWLVRLTVWVFVVMSILRLAPKTAQEFIYFAF